MAGSSRPITGAEILSQESYATAIVRCEGEETLRRLMRALEPRQPIGEVAGVAYRKAGRPCATRPVIRDLDAYRIGWELIDHAPLQLLGRLARHGGAVLA
jgi:anaerobic magnesium-protoporphyrin IX monomethyl ester cyclase